MSADGLGGFVASWQWIGGGEYLFFGQTFNGQGVPTGPDFEATLNLAGYPVRGGAVVGSPLGPVFLWDENGFWARGLDGQRSRRGGDVRVGEGLQERLTTLPEAASSHWTAIREARAWAASSVRREPLVQGSR